MNTSNLTMTHIIDNQKSPLSPSFESMPQLDVVQQQKNLSVSNIAVGAVAYRTATQVTSGLIDQYIDKTGNTYIKHDLMIAKKGFNLALAFAAGGVAGAGIYLSGEMINMHFEQDRINRSMQRAEYDMNITLERNGGLASHYSRVGGAKI